jgi:hypothetical protein
MNKHDYRINDLIRFAKPGDILLIKTLHFTGKIISWWTNSSYNHTANYIGGGKMVDSVLKYGVSERFVADLGNFEWAILRPTEDIDIDKLIKSYDKYKGKKYDILGIIAFFIPFVKQKFGKMFCSEFTTTSYADNGYLIIPRKAYSNVHPEMVYQSWKLKEIARYSKKDGLQVF